jgi:type IV pilus assembly protein PilA
MKLPVRRLFGTEKSSSKGFTLIELLVVIGIISVLAVVVFVALNPSQRLKDAKDARRTSDVDTILTAIHAAIVDAKGTLPAGLSTGMSEAQLGTAASGAAIVTGGCNVATAAALDLSTPLVKYLKAVPIDPNGTAALTKYSVEVDANNIVTVRACGTEGATNISASR